MNWFEGTNLVSLAPYALIVFDLSEKHAMGIAQEFFHEQVHEIRTLEGIL